ncbi:MAG TPA: flagellar biosynthesis anti-sigma factor FlgM [Terriglobales bacterium]|jgi:anti-sigma28 factor (negative regulator of flagellin synthesis)
MRIDLDMVAAVADSQVEGTSATRKAQTGEEQNRLSQTLEHHVDVGKLATVAMNSPEVRSDKVQALQLQVRAGAYQVSAAQTAGALLEQLRVLSA